MNVPILDWLNRLQSPLFELNPYRISFSLLLLGVGVLLNRLIVRAINQRIENANRKHIYRKATNYLTTAVILIGMAFVWIRNLTFLTALLGFIAAGVAIALRDVIMSLFGWFKILWVHPFGVGDRIQIREIEGDIIDISPLHTVLLELGNWVDATQSTGRIVFLPNYLIFQEPLYNSTLGFPYLWDEFTVVLTFESNFEKAENILLEPLETQLDINYNQVKEFIRSLSNRYAIRYQQLEPTLYMSVVDSGVKFTLRYLTPSRGRREIRSRVSNEIMTLINEESDLELAYPTYRIFRREVEGKEVEFNP